MQNYKDVIYLIGMGLTMGFGLVVYAHSNFTTKEDVNRLEKTQTFKDDMIIKRLDRIESKLDRVIR